MHVEYNTATIDYKVYTRYLCSDRAHYWRLVNCAKSSREPPLSVCHPKERSTAHGGKNLCEEHVGLEPESAEGLCQIFTNVTFLSPCYQLRIRPRGQGWPWLVRMGELHLCNRFRIQTHIGKTSARMKNSRSASGYLLTNGNGGRVNQQYATIRFCQLKLVRYRCEQACACLRSWTDQHK